LKAEELKHDWASGNEESSHYSSLIVFVLTGSRQSGGATLLKAGVLACFQADGWF
jgi:hypothetical protein